MRSPGRPSSRAGPVRKRGTRHRGNPLPQSANGRLRLCEPDPIDRAFPVPPYPALVFEASRPYADLIGRSFHWAAGDRGHDRLLQRATATLVSVDVDGVLVGGIAALFGESCPRRFVAEEDQLQPRDSPPVGQFLLHLPWAGTRPNERPVCGWTTAIRRCARRSCRASPPRAPCSSGSPPAIPTSRCRRQGSKRPRFAAGSRGDHPSMDRRRGEVRAALGLRAAHEIATVRPTAKCRVGHATRSTVSSPPPTRNRACSLRPTPIRARSLRRLRFDLTGLPPSPDEVDAFTADHSPAAYERLVDRLLASPAVRRADGHVLARRGPLCRQRRLPQRQRARPSGCIAIT